MILKVSKRFISFIRRQADHIKKEGFSVLLQKIHLFLSMAVALPVIFVVRALQPLVTIRFAPLMSGRIGHFGPNTEIYLCERDAGMHGRRVLDIFYHNYYPCTPICNQQLKKMWDRTIPIFDFARALDRVNHLIPGSRKHVIPWRLWGDRDIYGLLARTQPHISFTSQEERLGYESLRNLGISEGAPFVCFIARESTYLDKMYSETDWNYHKHRDSNIYNYIPAVEELARRGYFAIRMGAIVKEKLNTTNPKIIDYAVNHRTDFLDIFLCAKCKFFLCSSEGLGGIPAIFRRPVARANIIPLEHVQSWGPDDLCIPKKLWLKNEHRFLTFRGILNSEISRLSSAQQYEQLGVEVIENTPEEITALVVEMDERLKGTWQTTNEDEELQRRFWSLFKPNELHQVFLSHIGAKFLSQNRELLKEVDV